MQKIAITYGILSGTITIMTLILGLMVSEGGSFLSSELFGYLTMLVALSMIFIGIKRYRDHELGGVIRFLPAFAMGLGHLYAGLGALFDQHRLCLHRQLCEQRDRGETGRRSER